MVRKSLLVVAALLVAAPLAAQDEHTWSSQRPDGHAPLGIDADRALALGELQFTYRFSKVDEKGIWFGNDSIPLASVFSIGGYQVVPVSQENLGHELEVAYGVNERLTVLGRVRYAQLERLQTADTVAYITEANELGDAEVSALYNFYRLGPYTANVQMGVLIPIGEADPRATTPLTGSNPQPLSYDMRPGAGVFAALPGLTVQAQNESATVGAQLQGQVHFGTNDSGFTPGDRLDGTLWAGYRLNSSFSISARVLYETWSGVEGFDPALDPTFDPSYDGFFAEGSRLSFPLGVNFIVPEESPLAGYRVALEYKIPVDQEFEGPQLGYSRGLVVGIQAMF